MSKTKQYRWNRNAATHRGAIIRFSVFSFVYSVVAGFITILTIGIFADGSREFINQAAVWGLVAMIITFTAYLNMMTYFYSKLVEEDATEVTEKQPKHEWAIWNEKDGGQWLKRTEKYE